MIAEESHEISSLNSLKNNEKVSMNVVCSEVKIGDLRHV